MKEELLKLFAEFEKEIVDTVPNYVESDFDFPQFIIWLRHNN
jgi:hypothetical protein